MRTNVIVFALSVLTLYMIPQSADGQVITEKKSLDTSHCSNEQHARISWLETNYEIKRERINDFNKLYNSMFQEEAIYVSVEDVKKANFILKNYTKNINDYSQKKKSLLENCNVRDYESNINSYASINDNAYYQLSKLIEELRSKYKINTDALGAKGSQHLENVLDGIGAFSALLERSKDASKGIENLAVEAIGEKSAEAIIGQDFGTMKQDLERGKKEGVRTIFDRLFGKSDIYSGNPDLQEKAVNDGLNRTIPQNSYGHMND